MKGLNVVPMKKFEDYEFQIEWIEDIESIDEDDKKKLYELRRLNRRRKTHLRWVEKHHRIVEEFNRREKLIKELEKEEKRVFDDISLLKKPTNLRMPLKAMICKKLKRN